MKNGHVTDYNSTVLQYCKSIGEFKPLSREEELYLIELAQSGDIEAKNKIVKSHLKFVIQIAKKFINRGVALEDLISEGNIGLTMAIDKYKKIEDVKFISYAVYWIQAKCDEAVKRYRHIHYYELNDDLLNNKCTSYNIHDENDTETIKLKDTISLDIDNIHYETSTNDRKLMSLLDQLSPRGKYIIICYFGLFNTQTKNLEEIGNDLHISRERVRQIKERSLRQLRSTAMVSNDLFEALTAINN